MRKVLHGSSRRQKRRFRIFLKEKKGKEKASEKTNLQRRLAHFLLALLLNSEGKIRWDQAR